jgi:hypothetical protein
MLRAFFDSGPGHWQTVCHEIGSTYQFDNFTTHGLKQALADPLARHDDAANRRPCSIVIFTDARAGIATTGEDGSQYRRKRRGRPTSPVMTSRRLSVNGIARLF